MVCSQTNNPTFGTFVRTLEWKILVYLKVIWNILKPFGIVFDHFGNVVVIWYIFRVLVYCVNKNLATPVQAEKLNTGRVFP
jgi:hypothetical protein